ncbi:MAG: DNRLRE domain-containing protein [Candidatus Tritonobacter lacicola]|nr:DNRLRE domain-containing protein [Candidatus Tritonobacter lacicola]
MRTARAITAAAALAVAGVSHADDFVKGPWVQNVTQSSIVVTWEADEQESSTPSVAYGKTTAYGGGTAGATLTWVNGRPVYSASLTGLSTDTIYHYRVTSGATQTAHATFKTAPPAGAHGFRFYVAGDNRTDTATWSAVAQRIRADMDEYPAHHQTFVLNSGDVVTDGRYYSDWSEMWPPAQSLLSHLPMYVGLGNHEDRTTAASDAYIYGYFDFPYAGSGSTDEKWYSFDYGNVHVAAMALWDNAGYTSGPQYNWIQSDLDDARNDVDTDWTFAIIHFLPWSLGEHTADEAASIQTSLHPVFRDKDVTCAFGGHNHLYCRYAPVDGVTYITSGGAGAGLHTGSYSAWAGGTLESSAQVNHYLIVDVGAAAVAVKALDLDGNRLDYVTFGGTPLNRPPLADAGSDVAGTTGSLTLNGTASVDPEGAGLTYEWTQVSGPTVTISGASTSQPFFTTAIPGTYVFQLRVRDGSYWSAPDFCAATVYNGTTTFTPAADTYIDDLNPGTNYGSSSALLLDTSSHQYHTYIRFSVSGVQGQVQSATLRLYCFDAGDTGEIRSCSDTSWTESSPTWNNPLSENGAVLASLAANSENAWSEADVIDGVAGNGAVAFAILPGGSGGADFHSRENTNKPQLVVTYAADLQAQDSDSDGLSDYDEIYHDGNAAYNPYHPVNNPVGTDADLNSADSDGDGWSDGIEARCGGNPLNAAVKPTTVRVNFQPSWSTPPSSYCPDIAQSYGPRGYGWQ